MTHPASSIRGEEGFSLVEVLMVISVSAIVLSATLAPLDSLWSVQGRNDKQQDSQDQSRRATEVLARQLRNLASPTDRLPNAVERFGSYDLVFQTVGNAKPGGSLNDRNTKRVRYCLGPATGGRATLWSQEEHWTTAVPDLTVPSTASCPDAAWPTIPGTAGNRRAVAQNLVNRDASPTAVPLFEADSATLSRITALDLDLLVDIDPAGEPAASRLHSGVFLRNQNRPPEVSFTAADTGTDHRVILNGSATADPEGASIKTFAWYVDGGSTPIANGPVAHWTAPGSTFPQTHSFTLKACDPAFPATQDPTTGLNVCSPDGLSGQATVTGVEIR